MLWEVFRGIVPEPDHDPGCDSHPWSGWAFQILTCFFLNMWGTCSKKNKFLPRNVETCHLLLDARADINYRASWAQTGRRVQYVFLKKTGWILHCKKSMCWICLVLEYYFYKYTLVQLRHWHMIDLWLNVPNMWWNSQETTTSERQFSWNIQVRYTTRSIFFWYKRHTFSWTRNHTTGTQSIWRMVGFASGRRFL